MTDDERAREIAGHLGYTSEMRAVFIRAVLKHFAAIRADEREKCAQDAEAQRELFLSPEYATGQPLSSFSERFACDQVAAAIRARGSE